MLLIRYMPLDYGLKSIMSGEFKVARPCDVNDPYEMMGACVGQPRDDVWTAIRNNMRYEWAKRGADPLNTRQEIPIEQVEFGVDHIVDCLQRVFMERTVQQLMNRILCFIDASKINPISDQLMWGHYANNGKGMRVWFESDVLRDAGMPQIFQVDYKSERPTLDLSKLNSFDDYEVWYSFVRKLWLTKSTAWEYEHEWRMLILGNPASELLVEREGLEFVKLPISSIVRVDFGPKGYIEESTEIVRELRHNASTKHIDFRIAQYSKDAYNYDYLEYDRVGLK